MITDKQAAYIARWNETRDTALGFIRKLLADRAERDAAMAQMREALRILLASRDCIATDGGTDIPEELSAQFDITLNAARFISDVFDPENTDSARRLLDAAQTIIALKVRHSETWRDKDESYWMDGLREEVDELSGVLNGTHIDTVELELKQIASICLNWLEMRAARAAGLLRNEDGDEARQGFGPIRP